MDNIKSRQIIQTLYWSLVITILCKLWKNETVKTTWDKPGGSGGGGGCCWKTKRGFEFTGRGTMISLMFTSMTSHPNNAVWLQQRCQSVRRLRKNERGSVGEKFRCCFHEERRNSSMPRLFLYVIPLIYGRIIFFYYVYIDIHM